MTDDQVEDYDKSAFFRLLQSSKYRARFEFVQEQQGLVVCPLRFRLNAQAPASETAEIVDRHLFLPSPFYKSRYIPLISLLALSMLNAAAGGGGGSVPLDHSPKINLILGNSSSGGGGDEDATDEGGGSETAIAGELLLMNGRKRICKSVKLISTQLAYSVNSFKVYKILIVNRPLSFKRPLVAASQRPFFGANSDDDESDVDGAASGGENERHDDEDDELYDMRENEYDAVTESPRARSGSIQQQQQQQQRRRRSGFIPAVSHRNSTFMRPSAFRSINDIKTYRQSIEFMHDTVALVNVNDDDDDDLEEECSDAGDAHGDDDDDNTYDLSRRLSGIAAPPVKSKKKKKKSPKFAETVLGDRLIQEMELFRKTYIILASHMADCAAHLERIYRKYVRKFLKSFAMFTGGVQADGGDSNAANSNVELMVAIACEITIAGYVYTKIWPAILKLNRELDEAFSLKCRQLVYYLKLDSTAGASDARAVPAERLAAVASFLQLEPKYFLFNAKSVLKELSRLSYYNNPFEQLQCIKTSLDLLTNELTLSMAASSQQRGVGSGQQTGSSSLFLTSETLIPLLAYILVRAGLECVHSVVYFIDHFQFSYRPEDDSSVSNTSHSTYLAELAYFLTTFKASIEFIENLNID